MQGKMSTDRDILCALFLLVLSDLGSGSVLSNCDGNVTSVVDVGQNVTFDIHNPYEEDAHFYLPFAYFDGENVNINCFIYNAYDAYCYFPRFNISLHRSLNLTTVTLYNVQLSDKGVYYFEDPSALYQNQTCVFLHVLDMQILSNTLDGYVEEGDSIKIDIENPNITYWSVTEWFIGDENVTDGTARVTVTPTSLEIRQTTRDMNNVNVTYVVTEHDNVVAFDVTLMVAYGPGRDLRFAPERTLYYVNVGEKLPMVTCSADCNPPCSLLWRSLKQPVPSNGSELFLGVAQSTSGGEYECTATRVGTHMTMSQSLYVVVKEAATEDNGDAKIAMIVSIVAVCLSVVVIVVLVIYILKGRYSREPQSIRAKGNVEKNSPEKGNQPGLNYSDLQKNVRSNQPEEEYSYINNDKQE